MVDAQGLLPRYKAIVEQRGMHVRSTLSAGEVRQVSLPRGGTLVVRPVAPGDVDGLDARLLAEFVGEGFCDVARRYADALGDLHGDC